MARQAAVLPAFALQAGRPAEAATLPNQSNLVRLFSLKHEFPSEWYKFLNPPDTAGSQTMQIGLTIERFPFQYRGKKIQISQVELFLKFKDIEDPTTYTFDPNNSTPLGDYVKGGSPLAVSLAPPTGAASTRNQLTTASGFLNGIPFASIALTSGLGTWQLAAPSDAVKVIAPSLQNVVAASGGGKLYRLKSDVIDDIFMVCHYSAK